MECTRSGISRRRRGKRSEGGGGTAALDEMEPRDDVLHAVGDQYHFVDTLFLQEEVEDSWHFYTPPAPPVAHLHDKGAPQTFLGDTALHRDLSAVLAAYFSECGANQLAHLVEEQHSLETNLLLSPVSHLLERLEEVSRVHQLDSACARAGLQSSHNKNAKRKRSWAEFEDRGKKRVQADPSQVQIQISSEEVHKRLNSFLVHKEQENNLSNQREFRDPAVNGSARTSSAQIQRKYQIKKLHIHNQMGPLSHTTKEAESESSGVEERITNLESYLGMMPNAPARINRDVYVRLKKLEDKVLKLEKLKANEPEDEGDLLPTFKKEKPISNGKKKLHEEVISDSVVPVIRAAITQPEAQSLDIRIQQLKQQLLLQKELVNGKSPLALNRGSP